MSNEQKALGEMEAYIKQAEDAMRKAREIADKYGFSFNWSPFDGEYQRYPKQDEWQASDDCSWQSSGVNC